MSLAVILHLFQDKDYKVALPRHGVVQLRWPKVQEVENERKLDSSD